MEQMDTPIYDSIHWAYQNRFLYVGHLPTDHEEYATFEGEHWYLSADSDIETYVIAVASEEYALALQKEFEYLLSHGSVNWETYVKHEGGSL